MAELILESVSQSYGKRQIIADLSFHLPEGAIGCLLGPSGCGKTTALRCISGFEPIQAGEIRIGGEVVSTPGWMLPAEKRRVGMVFQDYALFPHLSVADNVGFGLRGEAKAQRQARIDELLVLVGLAGHAEQFPHQLSGGQQQRVALGRALVAQAKVCLMDEPLSNLDAQLRQEMRLELRELQRQLGLTVVYVTHDQAEAMSMADQVVLLNKGAVEQDGSARELYSRPASSFVARFVGTPPMNLLQLDGGRIAGSQADAGVQAAQLGLRPESIRLGDDGIGATVQGSEYLGADLVLRCAIGSQSLLVRADGQTDIAPGQAVRLRWSPGDAHAFDSAGRRITSTGDRQ
jgi:sn-glycerol 3-phosphate transport system ATP-binding protein